MRVQSAASRQRETAKQVKLVDADVAVNRQNEIRDMIARRAYESFERRGRVHGHDINDWIDAELEVVHPCRHELKEAAGALIFLAELPGTFTADQIIVMVVARRFTVSGVRGMHVTL